MVEDHTRIGGLMPNIQAEILFGASLKGLKQDGFPAEKLE
jgi:hypothetical protein